MKTQEQNSKNSSIENNYSKESNFPIEMNYSIGKNCRLERNSPQFVAVDPTHTTITSERIDPNIYYSRSPLPRKPPRKVVSKTFFTMDNLALITQSTGLTTKAKTIFHGA